MASVPKSMLTSEQYLCLERNASFKSEFYRGEMFAMAGATHHHNLIVGNLVTGLNNLLRQSNCQVYPSDMRVKVSPTGLYTYPDVVVACDKPMFEDSEMDTLLNPRLIIEVLSESTEAYDRGAKFEQYRSVESLQEYLLVAQNRVFVERYQRQSNGTWLLSDFHKSTVAIPIDCIDCKLVIEDIYFKVDFATKGIGLSESPLGSA